MLHDFRWIFLRLCEAAGREQSGAQAFTTFREETTQLSFQRNVFGEGVLLQIKAVWTHLGNITVIKMTREGCALLPASGDRRRGREKVRRFGKLEHKVLAAVAQHAGLVPPRPLRGELLVREPGLGLLRRVLGGDLQRLGGVTGVTVHHALMVLTAPRCLHYWPCTTVPGVHCTLYCTYVRWSSVVVDCTTLNR